MKRFLFMVCLLSSIGFTCSGYSKNLVLIHGLGQSASIFNTLEKEVSPYFDAILKIELPGHGDDLNESFLWNKENIVQHINSKLQGIDGSMVILGWSLGATIATDYVLYAQDQKNIEALFLIGGIYEWTGKYPAEIDFPSDLLSPDEAAREVAINVFADGFNLGHEQTEDIKSDMRKVRAGTYQKAVDYMVKEGSRIISKLAEVKTNLIFIHGKEDKLVNYLGASHAHSKLPNSKLILEDAGHAVFLKNPDKFSYNLLDLEMQLHKMNRKLPSYDLSCPTTIEGR